MTAGCGDYPVWAAALARRSTQAFFCYWEGGPSNDPKRFRLVQRAVGPKGRFSTSRVVWLLVVGY